MNGLTLGLLLLVLMAVFLVREWFLSGDDDDLL